MSSIKYYFFKTAKFLKWLITYLIIISATSWATNFVAIKAQYHKSIILYQLQGGLMIFLGIEIIALGIWCFSFWSNQKNNFVKTNKKGGK